jgi:alkylation response protein AidB-like acyl-CoA dehydrogenase
MDFEFSEEQQAISDLAGQILGDMVTHERLKEIETADVWFAAPEWQALADAGLVGIALPEAHGGAGFGILEAGLVLEQIGAHVAPVPYLATVVHGAMPVARFGTDDQKQTWLPGVIDGTTILSSALAESGHRIAAIRPSTSAEATEAGSGQVWTLDGEKLFVSYGGQAARVLVPATTPTGVEVFLVDPSADGVEITPMETTNGEPQVALRMIDAPGELLGSGGNGDEIVAWLVDHGTAAVCATQAGVCGRAVEMTGIYTSERQQFNAPIATFQAVAQRAADAYVDAQGVQFTSWQASWRLSEGLPADDALDSAKYWAAEGGQRVVHAAQHLHGGIGVDKDYPLHRYFLWAKLLELTLGSATDRLLQMGSRLAASGA